MTLPTSSGATTTFRQQRSRIDRDRKDVKGRAKEPARLIFNLETSQVGDEFERIKAAGATVIREPYESGGGWIATLADPDGNYFRLVTPM